MKKITLSMALSLCFLAYVSNAAVITVSNNPIGAGHFTDIQTAIDSANVGDTIYIHGSAITYNGASINKRLTIFGAGYAPAGTPFNLGTTINGLNLDTVPFGPPVSGTHIVGVNSSINADFATSNVTIERCYCYGITVGGGEGWIMQNNIISGTINLYGVTNNIVTACIIRNNFIIGSIYSNGFLTATGLLVDHNIMENVISTINYATITNNIFFFANISSSPNNDYNVYTNNLTVNSSIDTLPFGNNTGSGNLNNVTPSNTFSNGLTATVNFPQVLNYNWQVNSSSPGHNAATDGTDVGMYGGAAPMPNLTGASTLPQITLFNINNTGIPVNGTLYYELKARIQN